MEGLLSTDGLNELQDTWRRFDLHYAGARPWGEFFEQFKPTARDLDTRMATNWLHYKANYAQLTTLVVALGLLWWPTSLFALCVAAIASTASVTACPGRRILMIGSYSVKLTTKNRALAAAPRPTQTNNRDQDGSHRRESPGAARRGPHVRARGSRDPPAAVVNGKFRE